MADPEPAARAEFVEKLRALRIQSGNPSFAELSRLSKRTDNHLPKSTIHAKLQGRSPLDRRFVEAFVRACAAHAGHGNATEGLDYDLVDWVKQYTTMELELARTRTTHGHPVATEVRLTVVPGPHTPATLELPRDELAPADPTADPHPPSGLLTDVDQSTAAAGSARPSGSHASADPPAGAEGGVRPWNGWRTGNALFEGLPDDGIDDRLAGLEMTGRQMELAVAISRC